MKTHPSDELLDKVRCIAYTKSMVSLRYKGEFNRFGVYVQSKDIFKLDVDKTVYMAGGKFISKLRFTEITQADPPEVPFEVFEDLDVNDPASKSRVLRENVSLYEIFKIAAGYDDICSEWVNNYPITFDLAYPYLMEQLKRGDLNTAIVHTFLKVLSEYPDTFIARKVGVEKAREISLDVKKILELDGLETSEGRKSILELDRRLRESGNLLNPGTTADITAAALALCTLGGYRP